MRVLDTINEATNVGITLWVEGDELKFRAPRKQENSQIFSKLKKQKAEIISLLQKQNRYNKPYIDMNGDLIIPLDCEPRFKWWAGGQSIYKTLLELGASDKTIARYVDLITIPNGNKTTGKFSC